MKKRTKVRAHRRRGTKGVRAHARVLHARSKKNRAGSYGSLDLDTFFAAYVEAALFSSTDQSDDSGGEPLDKNYTGGDIEKASLEKMKSDCKKFLRENADAIESATRSRAAAKYGADEQAGHDFWMTRNGHGVGFWDGDWSEPQATQLTKAAKKFGEQYLYVGDDGKLYVS